MTAWWTGLDVLHQVFYLIAIPATVILVLQTVLLLLGLGQDGDTDVDAEVDHDAGVDVDYDDVGAQHMEGLRLLSLRGIVAFLAVSGWVGISMLDLGAANWVSVLVALVAGVLAMVLVALFMRFMTRLQQAGNLDVQNAVGVVGEVYIPLSAEQKGKVSLVIQERLTEMDAISTGDELKTGRQVRVVRVAENNLLVVEAV